MKGLTPKSPPSGMKIRSGTRVTTLLTTNEEPQGSKPRKALRVLPTLSRIFSIIPRSKQYGPNGIVRCDRQGIPNLKPYKRVAFRSGGAFIDVCKIDVDNALRSIFYDSIAANGSISLPERPISTTLRVYVDGTWVPRSRTNGFEYFPKQNKVALFGSYRPNSKSGQGGAPTVYAIHYRTYQPRCKSASGAAGCGP